MDNSIVSRILMLASQISSIIKSNLNVQNENKEKKLRFVNNKDKNNVL